MNQEKARGAALAFSLASKLVYEDPSRKDVDFYCSPGFFDASPFGDEDGSVIEGIRLMAEWSEFAAGTADQDSHIPEEYVGDLRRDWLSLIGGAGIPKAPSWAGFYLDPDSKIMSSVTLNVRKLYAAYGYRSACPNREPDDSLGIMLGFLAYLIETEVRRSDAPDGRDIADDQEILLRDFILPWIPVWHWAMTKYARTNFYHGVGEYVFGLCRCYAERFRIEFRVDGEGERFVKVA